MRQGKNFLEAVSGAAELEREPLPGIPLIEIYDQRRVLIENHRGVIGYCCSEVLVRVRFGTVCICGEDLYLRKMSKEQLVVTGRIRCINLRGNG